jgi:hypothetical protein
MQRGCEELKGTKQMEIRPRDWQPPGGGVPLAAYELAHDGARLIVLPARGAKIVSLLHLPSRKEWLWSNPHLAWKAPARGDSFVRDHDVGGWDECFPTVAPAVVGEREWTDHGDLWWRSWEAEIRDGALWTGVEGEGYRFEREIAPGEGGFRVTYSVANLSSEPIPYLWCAHPLVCTDPPLHVSIAGRPRVRLGNDSAVGKKGDEHRWPTVQERVFTTIGKPSGLAAKLFVEVMEGQIVLTDPDGATLRMRWPVRQVPWLGLWINESGWSGANVPPYCNAGIEPATGAPDDLGIALREWKSVHILPSGGQHSWWLQVSLSREP